MENDIQKISLEIESKSSQVGKGIEELTSQLRSLNRTVKPATKNLNSLSNSLTSLKNSARTINSINFKGVDRSLGNFSRSLNAMNNSLSGFTSVGAQLKDVSSGLNSLRLAFLRLNGMSTAKSRVDLSRFATELGKLTPLAKTADDFIKMRDGARAFSSGLNTMIKAGEKLPDFINKINALDLKDFKIQVKELSEALNTLSKSLEGVNKASRGINNNVTKMPGIVGRMNKSAQQTAKSTPNMLFSNAANMLSSFYMFKQMGYMLSYPIRKANDFIETMNLFNVVMGNSNRRAAEFITNLETIGVDWEQAMRYQSAFYDIGKSLGMVSKNAYTVSEQFTKLAYDYASLYNLPVEQSFQKLQAAMVGTVEPIRRLGKDISIAKLEEVALSLGIDKSVRSMNQAERAELRFIAVMQQSSSAMNDMERTINQPANALRVLKAQFTSLAREIGSLFIPILTSVLPYLIAVVKLIREIVQGIMGLFGIKLFELDFKQVSEPLGAIDAMDTHTDNIADNLDKSVKGAKKLKDYMIGIDELNVLNKDTGDIGRNTGPAGVGGGVGGLDEGGLGLDLSKFGYEEVLKNIKSKADQIYEKFRKWKKPLLVAAGILGAIWAVGKINRFIHALKGVGTASTMAMGIRGIAGLAKGIKNLAGGSGIVSLAIGGVTKLGTAIAGAFGVTGIGASAAAVIGLAALAAAIGGVVYAMQPAVKQMDEFKNVSEETSTKLRPIIDTWKELQYNLDKIDWTDKIITQKDIDDNVGKVKEMVKGVLDEVSSDRNEELKNLELLRDMKVISEETYQERKKELNKYYNNIETSTEDAETRIKEILQRAKKGKRKLTEDESEELSKLYKQIRDNAVHTMSESEEEQTIILSRLKHNSIALTVESGSKILKEAKKNKENQIKEAKATREEMINQLELRYMNSDDMTEEQYRKELKEIDELYDKQVEKAEKGYKDVNKEVKRGMGDEYKYINEKNGEIKSKWTVFWQGLPQTVEEYGEKIKKKAKTKMGQLKENLSTIDDDIKEKWDETWGDMKTTAADLVESLKTKWRNFTDWWDEHQPKLRVPVDNNAKGGGHGYRPRKEGRSAAAPTSLPVTGLARGGFIPTGGSFVSPDNIWTAGEAGREVIGNFRGRPTVMPLEDTGFVEAMYRAVKEGVKEAIDVAPINIDLTTKAELDGKQIFESQKEYQYSIGKAILTKI